MSKVLQLININPEDFKKEIVAELLKELPNAMQSSSETELLTREETAALLGISFKTIHEWKNAGKLKSYGIGNRVYFKRSEIMNALIPL